MSEVISSVQPTNVGIDTSSQNITITSREKQFLQSTIQRLQNELRNAHSLLRKAGITPQQSKQEEDTQLPPWAYDADTMIPLLAAYDTRIQELEDFHSRGAKMIENLRTQFDTICNENEELRKELADKTESLLQAKLSADGSFPNSAAKTKDNQMMSVSHSGNVQELQDQLQLMTKEISLLQQESDTLATENDDLRQALQQNQSLTQEYSQRIVFLTDALKRAQQNTFEISQKLSITKKQGSASNEQLLRTQKELYAIKASLASLEKERDDTIKLNQRYKASIEEVSTQSQQEIESMASRLQLANGRTRELQQKLYDRDNELDDTRAEIQQVKSELISVRHDCEGMVKVIQSLEKQVETYKHQSDKMSKQQFESTETASKATLERDSAVAREQGLRQEIQRLHSTLRSIRAEGVKRENDTVTELRTRLEEQVSQSAEQVDKATQKMSEIRAENDRYSRDIAQLRSELKNQQTLFTRETNRMSDLIQQTQEKTTKAEIEKEDALNKAQSQLEEAERIRTLSQRNVDHINAEKQAISIELQQVQSELDTMHAELETSQKRIHQLQSIQERDQKAFQMREEKLQSELVETRRNLEHKINTLTVKQQETSSLLSQVEHERDEVRNELRSVVSTLQTEFQTTMATSKKRIHSLLAELDRVDAQLRQIRTERDGVVAQHQELCISHTDILEENKRLRQALNTAMDEEIQRAGTMADVIEREEERMHELAMFRERMLQLNHASTALTDRSQKQLYTDIVSSSDNFSTLKSVSDRIKDTKMLQSDPYSTQSTLAFVNTLSSMAEPMTISPMHDKSYSYKEYMESPSKQANFSAFVDQEQGQRGPGVMTLQNQASTFQNNQRDQVESAMPYDQELMRPESKTEFGVQQNSGISPSDTNQPAYSTSNTTSKCSDQPSTEQTISTFDDRDNSVTTQSQSNLMESVPNSAGTQQSMFEETPTTCIQQSSTSMQQSSTINQKEEMFLPEGTKSSHDTQTSIPTIFQSTSHPTSHPEVTTKSLHTSQTSIAEVQNSRENVLPHNRLSSQSDSMISSNMTHTTPEDTNMSNATNRMESMSRTGSKDLPHFATTRSNQIVPDISPTVQGASHNGKTETTTSVGISQTSIHDTVSSHLSDIVENTDHHVTAISSTVQSSPLHSISVTQSMVHTTSHTGANQTQVDNTLIQPTSTAEPAGLSAIEDAYADEEFEVESVPSEINSAASNALTSSFESDSEISLP